MSVRHLVRAGLALTATAALTALGLPGLASADTNEVAGNSLVALGDSYSSGVGTENYFDDGTDCMRSPEAYSSLIAKANSLDLTLAACSGAVTSDVLSSQVSELSADTGYVTMTVGGNDVGFVPVLTECAKPGWMGDCDGKIDAALVTLRESLPAKLAQVNDQIGSRAPNAKVTVAGYPHIFNGEDCNAATFFSPEEEQRLNDATDELNSEIARQASAAGFSYAATMPTFDGHAVCDDSEWVNGLSWPIAESYHPNAAGHRGYASIFAPKLGLDASAASARISKQSATKIRTVKGATGSAPKFEVPDLSSAEAKAAAKKAGISPSELAKLRKAQQSGASNQTLEKMSNDLSNR